MNASACKAAELVPDNVHILAPRTGVEADMTEVLINCFASQEAKPPECALMLLAC